MFSYPPLSSLLFPVAHLFCPSSLLPLLLPLFFLFLSSIGSASILNAKIPASNTLLVVFSQGKTRGVARDQLFANQVMTAGPCIRPRSHNYKANLVGRTSGGSQPGLVLGFNALLGPLTQPSLTCDEQSCDLKRYVPLSVP